jgi:probable F420-dependent oxidoreductase
VSGHRPPLRWWMSAAMVPPEDLPDLVRAAEQAGFTGVTLPDSVFFPAEVSADYPYTSSGARHWVPETPMPDPLLMIAALAAVTTRIRFQTTVLKTPLRDPLLLAKQVATLATLSGDRLDLGVGLSWIPEEFRFTGTEMRTRGARLDEAIEIIRSVCADGPHWVEHHGRHYDFDRLIISPAPVTPVPILVGGHSEPALRRAARLGDGWISANLAVPDLERHLARLAELRAEHGRADARFTVCVTPDDRPGLEGFQRLAEAGATDVYLSPWGYYGRRDADRALRLDSVRRFADEVVAG